MISIYHGSAEGSTWCIIEGHEANTDQEAIEQARNEHGGDWILPILSPEKRDTWQTNPKQNGAKWMWLLRKI